MFEAKTNTIKDFNRLTKEQLIELYKFVGSIKM